jgi:tetratricopeptide (TPR) repeat protein
MLRTLVSFLTVSVLLSGCAHEQSSNTDLDWKIYKKATSVGDYVTAAGALTAVLVKDSTQVNVYDSLSLMYLNLGMDRSAAITAMRGLSKNETRTLLEVSASSLKNLGNIESSLQRNLRLLELNPNDIGYLYEVGYAYIQLQGYQQSSQFVEQIISHPGSMTTMMTEFVNKTGQKIPFKAVALNMRGFIQMQSGDEVGAIASYQEAIELVPDYQLALNNLKVLKAKAAAN